MPMQHGDRIAADVAQHASLPGLCQLHRRPTDLFRASIDPGAERLGKDLSTETDGQRRSVCRDARSKDRHLIGDEWVVIQFIGADRATERHDQIRADRVKRERVTPGIIVANVVAAGSQRFIEGGEIKESGVADDGGSLHELFP